MHKAISALLTSLMIVAVFDPADKLIHLKVPLFVAIFIFTLINYYAKRCKATVSLNLLVYLLIFSFVIPVLSICWYMVRDGSLNGYDGFQYLKAYMFLALCIPLCLEGMLPVRSLSMVLTAESLLILAIHAITSAYPLLMTPLYGFGQESGVFSLGDRDYGDTHVFAVYFHTSPLLVIPIAYFTYLCVRTSRIPRSIYLSLLAVNVAGMAASGTRNNLLAAFGTMLLVWFWYAKKKFAVICACAVLLCAALWLERSTIHEMLNPDQEGNQVKLQHLRDYRELLSIPQNLLLGQGLGASFNSSEYGYTSVTELTYMDLIRGYGLIGATPILCCLIYPLGQLLRRKHKPKHFLYLAYGVYLYLCTANPFLVSSSGMLVLAIILAGTFSSQSTTSVNFPSTPDESGPSSLSHSVPCCQ